VHLLELALEDDVARDNVLVVRVGVLGQVALDEVARLVGVESLHAWIALVLAVTFIQTGFRGGMSTQESH